MWIVSQIHTSHDSPSLSFFYAVGAMLKCQFPIITFLLQSDSHHVITLFRQCQFREFGDIITSTYKFYEKLQIGSDVAFEYEIHGTNNFGQKYSFLSYRFLCCSKYNGLWILLHFFFYLCHGVIFFFIMPKIVTYPLDDDLFSE